MSKPTPQAPPKVPPIPAKPTPEPKPFYKPGEGSDA